MNPPHALVYPRRPKLAVSGPTDCGRSSVRERPDVAGNVPVAPAAIFNLD